MVYIVVDRGKIESSLGRQTWNLNGIIRWNFIHPSTRKEQFIDRSGPPWSLTIKTLDDWQHIIHSLNMSLNDESSIQSSKTMMRFDNHSCITEDICCHTGGVLSMTMVVIIRKDNQTVWRAILHRQESQDKGFQLFGLTIACIEDFDDITISGYHSAASSQI